MSSSVIFLMSMPTKEETVQIGFRGTEDFRRRLQQAALDRGVKVQGLLEDLVERHIFNEVDGPHEPSEDLSTEDLAMARKFLRWMKKPKKSKTDTKLVKFVLTEIEDE
jgi:hypothetical protein